MDLHEFNARVLTSLGIVDETGQGHLSRITGSTSSPFTVNGKRVVLPTSEQLREGGKDTIVYHPLSENITRGESDMIKALRDTIMYQLTVRSAALVTELGRIAATPSEHKRLDPASSKYLKQLSEMDDRTFEFLQKVVLRIGPEPEKRMVSISLRKGQKGDGVLRLVKFKFPVLETMGTDTPDLLGVKYPSKKAKATVKTLFEIVLGDDAVREGYDFGSKNMAAPYFHALMNGYYNVATHLNDVIKQHKKLLGKELVDELLFDLTWYEGMDDLADMRKKVPPQEGNEGSIIVAEPKSKDEIVDVVSSRTAPRDRVRAEEPKEEIDLPWEDDRSRREARDEPRRETPAPKRKGKSLDDFLHPERADRDHGSCDHRSRDRDERAPRQTRGRDDRDTQWSRRESRDDRDFGRGGRDERGGGRATRGYDLGLGRGREERGYNDRDERSTGRRGFGQGSGSGRSSF